MNEDEQQVQEPEDSYDTSTSELLGMIVDIIALGFIASAAVVAVIAIGYKLWGRHELPCAT